jgi:ribonuclease-3
MADPNGPSPALSPADLEPVLELEKRLGVVFADRATALAALTHKSYVNEHRAGASGDNERLEFLGDAVIDLAVSHRLMERFPGAREGDLSKMRAAVVDEQGLAAMARDVDLGALLRLGRGEELTGGRRKASLLADAMEAVVAAVYLGDGLDGVLALVDRFLGEAFARAAAGTLDRDYKTQLQEQAQSRLRATPRYRVVAELGPDHAKIFEVEVDLRGEVLGRGAGRSKKDAEQAAAKLAIEALGRRVAAEPPAGRVLAPAAAPSVAPTPVPAGAAAAEGAVVVVEAEPVEPVATRPPAESPEKAAAPARRRIPKKKAAAKAPARAAKAKPARKATKPARPRQADRS